MDEYPNAVIQEVLDDEGYKAHKKQYGEETHKLHEEFVNDLFENFNVTDNPKRHKAFELAWKKDTLMVLKKCIMSFMTW